MFTQFGHVKNVDIPYWMDIVAPIVKRIVLVQPLNRMRNGIKNMSKTQPLTGHDYITKDTDECCYILAICDNLVLVKFEDGTVMTYTVDQFSKTFLHREECVACN